MNEAALAQAFLPPLLRAIIAGLAFSWVVVALGRRALTLLRVPLSSATVWERAFLAGTLGAGFLQYLPYGLAAFGVLRPGPLRVCAALLVLLLSRDLIAVARALLAEARKLSLSFSGATWAWVGLLAVVMFVLLVRASNIGDLTDDDGYHLASPKRWLGLGTLAYLPTYTNTNASNGFEMLYALGMALWDAIAAKAFNYSAGVFSLLGVWVCAKRISSALAGVFAVTFLLVANRVVDLPYVFALAYVDLGACWMAMGCLLTWLLWRERQEPALFFCIALCAGLTGSFKTTALATGIAWAPPVLMELRKRGATWTRSLLLLCAFGAVAALPVIPWFARTYRVTGNPLYPMLSSIIHTRDWPAQHAALFSRYTRYYSWGIGSGFGLSESRRKAILAVVIVAIGVCAAIAVPRMRRAESRGIVIFSALFAAISVCLTGLLYRYWLPSAMGLSVVLGVAVSELPRVRRWGFWPPAALMAAALAIQLRHNPNGHDSWLSDFRIATGIDTLAKAREKKSAWNVWRYINANTPVEARVLLADFYDAFGSSSSGGFWVDRTCYTTDSHLQTFIGFQDWAGFLSSIRAASIQYVVMPDRPNTPDRRGFSYLAGRNEYPFCRRLVDEYGEKVYRVAPLTLYRLK